MRKLVFFKKKKKTFLVLDIGTEGVKSLYCEEKNRKVEILDFCFQRLDRFGTFKGGNSESSIIKNALSELIKKTNFKKKNILISLPPDIFKARIAEQFFNREKPKEKISKKEQSIILKKVSENACRAISKKFAEKSGILPADLYWSSIKILDTKIEGYEVEKLQGYQGSSLEFKVLGVFILKNHFKNIKKIFSELNLKISKIIHLAEVLPVVFKEKFSDGAFFDIGGQISQILILKNGKLSAVKEFEKGGDFFTRELSQTLGIDAGSARDLKERYVSGELSSGARERIKEIFLEEKKNWAMFWGSKFHSLPVFLFGGGSFLPEIKEIFENAEIIYPKTLKEFSNGAEKKRNPQWTPALLISCYAKEIL